uniref:Rod shape-determining protein MreB n=1 Tax=Haemonchus contortus TaxID=6289 RepID=A0A7I4YX55_HAECO
MGLEGLSAASSIEKKSSDWLRQQLTRKDLQFEQLRQEAGELCQQRKVMVLVQGDDRHSKAQEAYLKDLYAIAPAVLRDYVERRLLNMPRNGAIVVHKDVQRTMQLNLIVIAQQMCAPQLPILHYPQWMFLSTAPRGNCEAGRGRGAGRGNFQLH